MSVGYTFFYKVASVWGWACIVNLHLHSRDKQLSHQPRVYTSHPHLTNYNINSELNWIQLTDHELFTVLKSTHCLLIVALSCSLITQSWFWVSCKGADDWRSIFFSSNKRLTRGFYRISEQLLREVVPAKKKTVKKKKTIKALRKMGVNPLLTGMPFL